MHYVGILVSANSYYQRCPVPLMSWNFENCLELCFDLYWDEHSKLGIPSSPYYRMSWYDTIKFQFHLGRYFQLGYTHSGVCTKACSSPKIIAYSVFSSRRGVAKSFRGPVTNSNWAYCSTGSSSAISSE